MVNSELRSLKVLHISSRDVLGGAEGVASTLHQELKRQGMSSLLALGRKTSAETDGFEIDRLGSSAGPLRRLLWQTAELLAQRKKWLRMQTILQALALPGRWMDYQLGREDYHAPGSWELVDQIRPDIVHCHNMEGYIDLRALSRWSKQAPVILHLHDMWNFTGHCVYSLDCRGFESGCGRCPYLSIPRGVKRDATAYNVSRKVQNLNQASIYAIAPSQWMADQIERSQLRARLVEVIPNGTDLTIFRPGDQARARDELRIARDAKIIACSGRSLESNPFKDFSTTEEALRILGAAPDGQAYTVLSIGSGHAVKKALGTSTVIGVPFSSDPHQVARYLQAADLLLHTPKAETFGKVITEAMACGKPVVATCVGGIPEIVKVSEDDPATATGMLVPSGDVAAVAASVRAILENETLRRHLGSNACYEAKRRYDLTLQTEATGRFYVKARKDWLERTL